MFPNYGKKTLDKFFLRQNKNILITTKEKKNTYINRVSQKKKEKKKKNIVYYLKKEVIGPLGKVSGMRWLHVIGTLDNLHLPTSIKNAKIRKKKPKKLIKH